MHRNAAQRRSTTISADNEQVLRAIRKETHFFTLFYARGAAWYRAHFPTTLEMRKRSLAVKDRTVTGEATPYYVFHPCVPDRVHELLPSVSIIVLLRDPVDRAYSHYMHNRRKGRERRSFQNAVDEELRALDIIREEGLLKAGHTDRSYSHQHFSYVNRGIYLDQLARWNLRFPRKQMLILQSEQLFSNTGVLLQQVCEFLNIKHQPSSQHRAFNRHGYSEPMAPMLRRRLVDFYAAHNQALFDWLGTQMDWR